MVERKPRAPVGLGARGRAFWRHVTADYDLERGEAELLVEIVRTMDVIEALAAAVESDGLMVEGSRGQRRMHPALAELRGQRAALARLLGLLGLPDESGAASIESPARTRARRAAEVRWRGRRGPA